MPKIQPYESMTVELMVATPHPESIIALAQSITMNSAADADINPMTHKQVKFLVDAEHTSLLEHVTYTFLVQGISRSLLAQVTRQRTGSPTSGSQHYQDYSDYPCAVHSDLTEHVSMCNAIDVAFSEYKEMLDNGEPREEARQCLPNAACVNYLWTIDARNLFFFLRQRLCHRNVSEMQVFANKVLTITKAHFPQLFDIAGPQCFMGDCKQGFLSCGYGPWEA